MGKRRKGWLIENVTQRRKALELIENAMDHTRWRSMVVKTVQRDVVINEFFVIIEFFLIIEFSEGVFIQNI